MAKAFIKSKRGLMPQNYTILLYKAVLPKLGE
jgi:hypothetical protein